MPDIIQGKRLKAGMYEYISSGHTYVAFRVKTCSGDVQWFIDRDEEAQWEQTDTLAGARLTIARDIERVIRTPKD